MMKKTGAALLLALLLVMMAFSSTAEINVTRRTLNMAEGLDKNVNHVLVIMQDGDVTNTLMLASINSRTGRAVMTKIDPAMTVQLTDDKGRTTDTALADVYVQGGKKSRGLLVCREINEMLGLDVDTYVALDIAQLPALVDVLGTVRMNLNEAEAAAMGMAWDYQDLTGEQALTYVRLALEGDAPERSRCYDLLMQMLYQGVHGDLGSMMSMGGKLLGSMDTNVNVMTAMTLVSAVQGGDDRREIALTAMTQDDARTLVHKEIYE